MGIIKVLIIDDEELIRATTSLLLRRHGFDVDTASDGTSGIDRVVSWKPDLILLDIMMPEMDGWEVLTILNKTQEASSIPVIIFTAVDGDFSVSELHKRGAYGLIRKPFHLKELLTIIEKTTSGGADE